MQTQICSKCKLVLDVNLFHKNKKRKSGILKRCKNCVNSARRLWIEKTDYKDIFYKRCHGDVIKGRAKVMYSGLISRSREKGFKLDKSKINEKFLYNWMINVKNCECCGRELDFSFKGIHNYASPSIDRFNNEIWYEIGNIHLLCWRCNTLKNNHSIDDFKKVLSWMIKKHK